MKKNLFVMAILVVSIAMVLISTVSAVDDNSTMEAVNEVSQDTNLVIDDVDGGEAVFDGGALAEGNEHAKENNEKRIDVSVDCHSGDENTVVKTTPTIRDGVNETNNVISSGFLGVCDDSNRSDLISAVSLDDNSSFKFDKSDDINNIHYGDVFDNSSFNTMKTNNPNGYAQENVPPETLAMPFIPNWDLGYEREYVQVLFDTTYGVEGSEVLITPTVYDSKGKVIKGGVLKIYSDYFMNNLIATIDLDECTYFKYDLPDCPDGSPSLCLPIYYSYQKWDDDTDIHYMRQSSFNFTVMDTNNLEISVFDSRGRTAENGSIVIGQGEQLSLVIDNLEHKVGDSKIKIMVKGVDNNRCFMQEFNFDYATHKILINDGHFPLGEYVIYAVYDGYVDDGNYFASAISNPIFVNVVQKLPFDFLYDVIGAIRNILIPA